VAFLKTTVAARTLGVPYHQLISIIRSGHLDSPSKDSSGHYLWSPSDISRARQVLARRRPRRTAIKQEGGYVET
jgi:hypothetical protein